MAILCDSRRCSTGQRQRGSFPDEEKQPRQATATGAGRKLKKGRTPAPPKPRGKTPWRRGPAAYEVADHADEILEALDQDPEAFYSLRQAAALLGVSTQPLREWHRDGWLAKGPRGLKFPTDELYRFVVWLSYKAKPYEMKLRVRRFRKRGKVVPRSFEKLRQASFKWPKGCPALRPQELAKLIGCDSSLIIKAIARGWLGARIRVGSRKEITRRDFRAVCGNSI